MKPIPILFSSPVTGRYPPGWYNSDDTLASFLRRLGVQNGVGAAHVSEADFQRLHTSVRYAGLPVVAAGLPGVAVGRRVGWTYYLALGVPVREGLL